MPFDLADALKNKRSDLKSVTTKVISIDGTESEERRGKDGTFEEVDLLGDINEDGEEVTVSNRRRKKVERAKKMGFVVDLKPDLQVAEAAANVFLGSQDVAADFQLLKRHGITAIVNAAAGVANLYPKNFDYLRVELLDLPETDILKELPAVLRFIYDNVNSGGRVLVHCNAGVSRAASIVLAYMIKYNNLSFHESFSKLRALRPAIQPNSGFVKQLIEFDKICRQE
uniref:Dual specificity protein phosphatase 19 n=1 Tax=Bursaphelenchus xylophilus TaxID=6326 RepID=A0A1I7SVT5_BURXY